MTDSACPNCRFLQQKWQGATCHEHRPEGWCCTNCLGENQESAPDCKFCGASSPTVAHEYARSLER